MYFLTKVDTYGTQQPIALLKLLLEKGGMYDRGKELYYKYLRDLSYIAAMGKAGGGRNEASTLLMLFIKIFFTVIIYFKGFLLFYIICGFLYFFYSFFYLVFVQL